MCLCTDIDGIFDEICSTTNSRVVPKDPLYSRQGWKWAFVKAWCKGGNCQQVNDRYPHILTIAQMISAYNLRLKPCGKPPQMRYISHSWRRHQMDTFFALLALCEGNSPVTGEFPSQTPVTRSFDVFFDLRLNKRLSKQSWGWCFETPSRSLWHHCNVKMTLATFKRKSVEIHQLYRWLSLLSNTESFKRHLEDSGIHIFALTLIL